MMNELCLPCAKLLEHVPISSVSSSQDFPKLNLRVSLQGLVQQNIPVSTKAILSSITKPDSMSNRIKEGGLT